MHFNRQLKEERDGISFLPKGSQKEINP